MSLRKKTIRLAYERPDLRPHLLPLLRAAEKLNATLTRALVGIVRDSPKGQGKMLHVSSWPLELQDGTKITKGTAKKLEGAGLIEVDGPGFGRAKGMRKLPSDQFSLWATPKGEKWVKDQAKTATVRQAANLVVAFGGGVGFLTVQVLTETDLPKGDKIGVGTLKHIGDAVKSASKTVFNLGSAAGKQSGTSELSLFHGRDGKFYVGYAHHFSVPDPTLLSQEIRKHLRGARFESRL